MAPAGSVEPPQAMCLMTEGINQYIRVQAQNSDTKSALFDQYLNDFRSGRALVEIAEQLRSMGLVTDHDVEYVRNIPTETQTLLAARILSVLERSEHWMVQFNHEPGEDFSVRLDEDDDNHVATFVLIGPHA